MVQPNIKEKTWKLLGEFFLKVQKYCLYPIPIERVFLYHKARISNSILEYPSEENNPCLGASNPEWKTY